MNARPLLAIAFAAALAAGCGGGNDDPDSRGGPSARDSADDVLRRDPYMGVSCRTPNSFACDRVGLTVWLSEPGRSVDAEIAGRRLELDDPEWSGPERNGLRRMFAGFLQPAGLINGPLEVTADAGPDRWLGRKPVSASVNLSITRADGTTIETTALVGLSPGWG